MKKEATNTRSDRQMKFAEAGILFVFILGLTLFVGAKIASKDTEPQVAATAQEAAAEVAISGASSEAPAIESGDPGTQEVDAIVALEASPLEMKLEAEPPRVVTYALSEQAFFAGNFAEAADLFSAYTLEHPGNAWGHYMLGLSSWKSGDLEAAEEAFVAALAIKPDHLKSRINYGRVLLELDRSQEAQVQLEAALAIDPNSVDANRVLGRAYHNLGLLAEAAESYRTALAIKGDDVWALNNLGLLYIEQEQFSDALPPLAKAAELKQDVACIQNNLGVALERTGHIVDSRLAFERALAANDQYAKAEESLERVSAIAAAEDAPNLDLAAMAASFTTGPEDPAEAVSVESSEVALSTADIEPGSMTVADNESKQQ